jgi:hypothetical protein
MDLLGKVEIMRLPVAVLVDHLAATDQFQGAFSSPRSKSRDRHECPGMAILFLDGKAFGARS